MDVRGLSRGTELHDMLKAEVMLRRLKQDVLSQVGGCWAGEQRAWEEA